MRSLRAIAAILLLRAIACRSSSPVEKVIHLLQIMRDQGEIEMNDEEHQYETFKLWCDSTKARIDAEQERLEEEIKMIQSMITAGEEEQRGLNSQLSDATTEKNTAESDLNHTTVTREIARAEEEEAAEAQAKVIQSLHDAKKVVKAQEAKASDSSYESAHSSDVLTALEALFDTERASLNADRAANQEREKTHKLSTIALENTISQKELKIDETTKALAESKIEMLELSKEESTLSSQAVAEDNYEGEVNAICEEKATAYEDRRRTREDEIEEIGRAITILSEEVKNISTTYRSVSSLQAKGLALVYLKGLGSEAYIREKAREFLLEKAKQLKSNALASLADEVTRSKTPFENVIRMIQALIDTLKAQGEDELKQNVDCTQQLEQQKIAQQDAEAAIKQHTARSELLQADIGELDADIAALKETEAALGVDMVSMTQETEDAEATRNLTKSETGMALAALDQATQLLRDFYKLAASEGGYEPPTNSSESATTGVVEPVRPVGPVGPVGRRGPTNPSDTETGVVEPVAEDPANSSSSGNVTTVDGTTANSNTGDMPEIFGDEPYQGMQDRSRGVFAVLQQVKDDFEALLEETDAEDAKQKQEYKEFKAKNEAELSAATRERLDKEGQKDVKTTELGTVNASLVDAQTNLGNAKNVYEGLKGTCIYVGASHREREESLDEEIAALQEALRILNRE